MTQVRSKTKDDGHELKGGGIKQDITEWSQKSRREMLKNWNALEWERLGDLLWIGLTYPTEFPKAKESKKDLIKFWKRWEHHFGKVRGVWKLEFQRRGAPHYHLLLQMPGGYGREDAETIKETLNGWWSEICGNGSEVHKRRGVYCEVWKHRGSPASYVAAHGEANTKEHQNHAPEGESPGRWWGTKGIRPRWVTLELEPNTYFRARRMMQGLMKGRARRDGKKIRKKQASIRGLWVASQDAIRIWSYSTGICRFCSEEVIQGGWEEHAAN